VFQVAGRANALVELQQPEDAAVKRARQLMDEDETSRSNMREAAAILEAAQPKAPTDARIPLYLAEAYYRMVDPAEDIGKAYPYFEKAGAYAEKALQIDPDGVQAHYWRGLFLLRKAQHGSFFQAYFVTREGIAELEQVRQRAPEYEHAGASRTLSLLYLKAPGWSPFGDLDKAVTLAEEATELAPQYLLNRVYLAEAYQKRGDRAAAVRECRRILDSHSPGNRFEEKARSIMELASG